MTIYLCPLCSDEVPLAYDYLSNSYYCPDCTFESHADFIEFADEY